MMIERDSQRWQRLVVSGVLFVVVAAMIYKNSVLLGTIDAVLQTLLTTHTDSSSLTLIMKATSFVFEPKMDLLWMVVIAFVLWRMRYRIPAIWTVCTVLGGDVLGTITKHLVKRARPAQHLSADDGYSFPSGHTLGAFLIIAVLFLAVMPLIRSNAIRFISELVLVFLMVLLAVSRVFLYAHYPFDTIGAMLLAYAWLQVAEMLYVGLAPRLSRLRFAQNTYY